jgi:small nuclear ribonucleoprotein (snRNP)-like protein
VKRIMVTHRVLRISICLGLAILVLTGSALYAQGMSLGEVKSKIKALAAKQNTEVQITLKDGTVFTGRIHQPGAKDFIMITSVRAQAYAYTDVAEVKKTGSPSKGKIAGFAGMGSGQEYSLFCRPGS